jgi:hypothetical protein
MTLESVHYLGADVLLGARGAIMLPRQGTGVANFSESGDWHALWMHFSRASGEMKGGRKLRRYMGDNRDICLSVCRVPITTLALILALYLFQLLYPLVTVRGIYGAVFGPSCKEAQLCV